MKKIVVLMSALVLVAFASQAGAAGMYGGIKAGANFANMSEIDDSSMRTGFQGGLFLGKDVNEEFGFRVEGLWVQKGVTYDETFDPGTGPVTVEVETKLDYIEFPILFVFNVSNSETMGFNLFAGPTLGFNVGANASADDSDDVDIKDSIESFEFGAAIGAGIAKKMAGGKAIGLDARYTLGATGVIKDVPDGEDNPKNRGIGLMAFFQVPLGSQE
jgi:hypothetical protein